ncbi:MAG TPA: hypothetical protein PKC21_08745 [Oligoflexia bacterium]|nr:hypothetical protein [Oligoflexia bacterium]HMR25427.1 hypothetical protein [Oligoflexia bacterium]
MSSIYPNFFKLNRLNSIGLVFLTLTFFLFVSCSGKKPSAVTLPSDDNTLERMYKESPDYVFKKLLETLKTKFDFNYDFVDESKYILSTTEVREQSIHGPKKYRINASVHADDETGASTLRIYKQVKIFQNNQWESVPSDKVLEESIFEALKH